VSFHFSSGTLDSMAGVFAPSKKHRFGTGGGKGRGVKSGGTMIGLAVASMFPKANATTVAYRSPAQTKRAFGGSSQAAVSRRATATMERTARRVPEVMVRITGRQHGGAHVLANFSYISRLGHGPGKELGLHTSEGDVIHDGGEMQKLAQEWQEWEMGDDARRKGATSLSMILSMPSGTDPEKVKAAAVDFARDEFANRSWVASLHVDRDHPHVHLTIARRDHDGRRFHPNRDDLFHYRQRFAEKLRGRGIEANATPAKARGIDPQHEHIAALKVREKGGVPRLDKSRAERVDRYREDGRKDPVEGVLREQRATVRAAYERSIAELSASPSMVNQMVAKSLQRFVDGLPEPEPNSARAARLTRTAREIGGPTASPRRFDKEVAKPDALAAALARLRDAQDRSEANRNASEGSEDRPAEAERLRQPAVSDRLRALMDEADKQSATEPLETTAEILRQVRQRDRAHRERDRSPDKGGPRR
jgi:hypothetical protein